MLCHQSNIFLSDGKNGMGQAQSQSLGGDCSDCLGSGEGTKIFKSKYSKSTCKFVMLLKTQENTEDLIL